MSKKVIGMTAWKTVHLILHICLWDKQIPKKDKTFALQSMSAYKLSCEADMHDTSFQAILFSIITAYMVSNLTAESMTMWEWSTLTFFLFEFYYF